MRTEINEKYINPYTDFGFKKLFGTELNKDLLLTSTYSRSQAFTPEERQDYEESVKVYRDLKNSLDTAVWKTNKEIARRMKSKGYAVKEIAEITGLTIKEIEGL